MHNPDSRVLRGSTHHPAALHTLMSCATMVSTLAMHHASPCTGTDVAAPRPHPLSVRIFSVILMVVPFHFDARVLGAHVL